MPGDEPDREEGVVLPMRLLQSGIPLTLLFDLVLGPESADLMRQEREDRQPPTATS